MQLGVRGGTRVHPAHVYRQRNFIGRHCRAYLFFLFDCATLALELILEVHVGVGRLSMSLFRGCKSVYFTKHRSFGANSFLSTFSFSPILGSF